MHAEATPVLPAETRKGALERALSVAADVRAGEGAGALLLLANLFVALFAYYLLKTLREPLVLATGGATLKSYAAAAQAVFLVLAVPAYGFLATRIPPRRLVFLATIASAIAVEIFALLAHFRVPYLGFAFYVFVGVFGVFAVAQFWSFANDLHDEAAGRRLFPLVGIGATVGSAAGSLLAGRLFDRGLPVAAIFHLSAGFVAVHAVLYLVLSRGAASGAAGRPHDAPLVPTDGFALVAKSPYLRILALALVVSTLVNSNGEFLLSHAVVDRAAAAFESARATSVDLVRDDFVRGYIGSFYGDFFLGVNVAAVLLQVLVASRVVRYGGLRAVLLAAPFVSLLTYGAAASALGFAVFRVLKSAENACDYSLANTAKALVWLPTRREEKYKAKQAIDTFFVRCGDVVSALLVFVGVELLELPTRAFAFANVGLAIVVLGLGGLLLARHRRLVTGDAVS